VKFANIVVYRMAGQDQWEPIMPADTPALLKEPEVMGEMVAGYIIEHDGAFYRAKKLAESKVVLSQKRAVMHRRPQIIQ
jgi:hypothetical protein